MANKEGKKKKINRNRECHQRVGEAGDARRGEILVRDERKQDTRDM